MLKMLNIVEVEKTRRNDYGQNVENLNISIPHTVIMMIRSVAKDTNSTVSRAITDLLILGYSKYREELEKNDK